MAIIFRTTGSWGAGKGSNLAAGEVDENFYELLSRISALEDHPIIPIGIDHFTVVGSQLSVTMTDATVKGPYTLPVAHWNFRGMWQPTTIYAPQDVFTFDGDTYLVLVGHTSDVSFDPGANDGLGHDLYGLIVSPAHELPPHGDPGQVLTKHSSSDFDVIWSDPTGGGSPSPDIDVSSLPPHGTTGQILSKLSSTDFDAGWITFSGGSTGATGAAGADGADGADGVGVPVGGTTGQILAKIDGTDFNTHWIDPPTELAPIELIIDGGGSVITTGLKGFIEVPYACTINRSTLLADQSGSIVIEIWKCTYANFAPGTHPVTGDKITASAPPTISSAMKAQDATLTGWTTAIAAGDILAWNVNSVTSLTRVTSSLKVTKS